MATKKYMTITERHALKARVFRTFGPEAMMKAQREEYYAAQREGRRVVPEHEVHLRMLETMPVPEKERHIRSTSITGRNEMDAMRKITRDLDSIAQRNPTFKLLGQVQYIRHIGEVTALAQYEVYE
mgnify:CR=1 FL=1